NPVTYALSDRHCRSCLLSAGRHNRTPLLVRKSGGLVDVPGRLVVGGGGREPSLSALSSEFRRDGEATEDVERGRHPPPHGGCSRPHPRHAGPCRQRPHSRVAYVGSRLQVQPSRSNSFPAAPRPAGYRLDTADWLTRRPRAVLAALGPPACGLSVAARA